MLNLNKYSEKHSALVLQYQEMLAKYDEMIQSEKYHDALVKLPFEFLNAKHMCENLSLYNSMEVKPMMHFSFYEDAFSFYKHMVALNTSSAELLSDAAYVVDIHEQAKAINTLVDSTEYLPSSLKICNDTEIYNLSKEVMEVLPGYPELLTKKMRYNFIESAIQCLNINELIELAKRKIITISDLDNITIAMDEGGYTQKYSKLCTALGHSDVVQLQYSGVKLKGVTYKNEDGTDRQENLKELATYMDTHAGEIIQLNVVPYIYRPEIDEEEPAVKIMWGKKELGNLGKDVVQGVISKCSNPQYTAYIECVTGRGEQMNLGCNIQLGILTAKYFEHNENSIER